VAKEVPSPELGPPAPDLVAVRVLALLQIDGQRGAAKRAESSRVCAFNLEEVAYTSLAKDVVAS
jgi:hypothetical protein